MPHNVNRLDLEKEQIKTIASSNVDVQDVLQSTNFVVEGRQNIVGYIKNLPEEEKKSALLYIAQLSIEDTWEYICMIYPDNVDREKIRLGILSYDTVYKNYKEICNVYENHYRSLVGQIHFPSFDFNLSPEIVQKINNYYISLVDLNLEFKQNRPIISPRKNSTMVEKLVFRAEEILDAKRKKIALEIKLQQETLPKEEKENLLDWKHHRENFIDRMSPGVIQDVKKHLEKYVGAEKVYMDAILEHTIAYPEMLMINPKLKNNTMLFSDKDGLYHLWDMKKGVYKELSSYNSVGDICDGYIKVQDKQSYKYGFINIAGEEVVSCKYDDVEDFSFGYAKVKQGDKYGFVDITGTEVLSCIYDIGATFDQGFFVLQGSEIYLCDTVGNKNLFGFFNDKNQKVEINNILYDHLLHCSQGYMGVSTDGKYGFIDKEGKEIVPLKYDDIQAYSQGLAGVKKDGKRGFIDIFGKEVISCKYDQVGDFSEGLVTVRKDGKRGFINIAGEEVVPCVYDSLTAFSGGLAKAEKTTGKKTILNKEGKEIIPYTSSDIYIGDINMSDNSRVIYIPKYEKKEVEVYNTICLDSNVKTVEELLSSDVSVDKIVNYQYNQSINKAYYHDRDNSTSLVNEKVIEGVTRQYFIDNPGEYFSQRPARILKNQYQFARTVFYQLHPQVREKHNRQGDSAESLFFSSYREQQIFAGGDMQKQATEIAELEKPLHDMLIDGWYGDYTNGKRTAATFPYTPLRIEPMQTNTVKIDSLHAGNSMIIPLPLGAKIQSIIAFDEQGNQTIVQETYLENGLPLVNIPMNAKVLHYTFSHSPMQPVAPDSTRNTYQTFTKQFVKQHGNDLQKTLDEIPIECRSFVTQLKSSNLSAIQKARAIEQYVRSVFVYDFKNGEVSDQKISKSLSEQLAICHYRAIELGYAGDKNILYAGVCEDAANLTVLLARAIGLLAGKVTGIVAHGTQLTSHDRHAATFVVMPGRDVRTDFGSVPTHMLIIDGTPNGDTAQMPSVSEHMQQLENYITAYEKESGEKISVIIGEETISTQQKREKKSAAQKKIQSDLDQLIVLWEQRDVNADSSLLEAAIREKKAMLEDQDTL